MVEDAATLAFDLAQAGIAAVPVKPPKAVDVRALRQRLGLTRERFAARFGLKVGTVRNWEAGRRDPHTTARSRIRAISDASQHVEQAYAASKPLKHADPTSTFSCVHQTAFDNIPAIRHAEARRRRTQPYDTSHC